MKQNRRGGFEADLKEKNILLENGYIYKGKHEGWYAVSDEAFYAQNQVQEVVDEKTGEKIMVAIESGQRVEWTEEENYKFKLSLFKDRLLEWIKTNPKGETREASIFIKIHSFFQ